MDPAVKAAGELNTIFARLEVPCEVLVTGEEGKHVRATAPLEAGVALVEELPIISWPSAPLLQLRLPFCFQCLRLSCHRLPSEEPTTATAAAAAAVLPSPSWTRCGQCESYFCSPECHQASARVHRLLCSCLPAVREAGQAGATASAPSSASSAAASSSSGITLEALARCVAWITHRLSHVIEQQRLTHDVLQADYAQQPRLPGGDAEKSVVWSSSSLNYQLFTQVVAPFSRLISPPDGVSFGGISLTAWMATLRALLAARCAKVLLVASGASLAVVQTCAVAVGDGRGRQAPDAAPAPLLWAEALVSTLFSDDTLRTLVGQMMLNAHAVNDYVLPCCDGDAAPAPATFDWILKGAGLYSLLASFNHSCAPNAAVSHVDDTHEVVLRTTRPVRAGEALTITYIPLGAGADSRAERQRQLKNYFFTCRCSRCVAEAAGEDAGSDVAALVT